MSFNIAVQICCFFLLQNIVVSRIVISNRTSSIIIDGHTKPRAFKFGNQVISNIINAHEAVGERPFFVRISVNDKEPDFKCGGSIIALQWVLTAAHCVYKFAVTDLNVHTGDFRSKSGKREVIKVERKIPHPAYVRLAPTYNPFYDIGLLLLAKPVGSNAAAIALCNRHPPYARLLGMCGMGPINTTKGSDPDVLQEAFFFEQWGAWWDLSVNCRDELICVESAVYDSLPTSGDSGSPLYLMGYNTCDPDQNKLAKCVYGVTAFRQMKLYKDDEFDYLFSNVPFFYRWIVTTINTLNSKISSG